MVGGISLIWAIPIEETTPMLKKAVAKYPFWKLDLSTAQFVRFRAADWDEFPSSRTGTGKVGTQFPRASPIPTSVLR